MAGGDHIHFGMLLDGVQIDPKEWWDPHWIKDHIAKRRGPVWISGLRLLRDCGYLLF